MITPPPGRSTRRLLLRLALAAGTFALGLAVVELGLRLRFREAEVGGNYWGRGAFVADTATGYTHAPGFAGWAVRVGAFAQRVEISAYGLRQRDLDSQLRHRRRLLVVGDSFAFGLGVAEEHAFAHLLAARLNPAGVGVLNGSQTGFSTIQTTRLAPRLLAAFEPQAVLVAAYLDNDVEGDFYRDWQRVDVRDGYRLSSERALPVAALDFLRTRSYLGLYASGRLNRLAYAKRRRQFLELARNQPEVVVEPTLAALRALARRAAEQGVRTGIALIPPRKGATPFDRLVIEQLAGAGIDHFDLAACDFTVADFFERDGHWNERGHRRAAACLANFVATLAAGDPAGGVDAELLVADARTR